MAVAAGLIVYVLTKLEQPFYKIFLYLNFKESLASLFSIFIVVAIVLIVILKLKSFA